MNKYLNESHNDTIESFYGKGTKIIVRNLSSSITYNTIIVEAVIRLGDEINSEVMEPVLCDVLIRDSMDAMYPDQYVKLLISWDS